MHAVRLHAFGPAENLTYEKTEAPEPGPGQVRIAVKAAGVHLLDTAIREGMQGPLPQLPELPTIPGREVAGVVDALGEGTDPTWLGKRVVTHLGFAPGGYAELAVVGAERLHEIPERLDEAAAVAMIGTGRTTMGILNFVDLGPDSVVVVPAAAGGIGSLIVQYAKNAGATVIGLAGGPAKVALVEGYGADLALDYKDANWAALAGSSSPTPTAGPRSSSTAWAATWPARRSTCSAPAARMSSSAGRLRASTAGATRSTPRRSSRLAASARCRCSGRR